MTSVKNLATRLQTAQQRLIDITQKLHDHLHSLRHDVNHPCFWWAGPIYCLWHAFPTGSPLLATHPCFDEPYPFRKLMMSHPGLNRLWSFFLHSRQMLDWNVITTPMTHEFALVHEQHTWFHQRLPPSEALSFCTIPYDFARILNGAYTTNHALCTTGAVFPFYSYHCPRPGNPCAATSLPSQSSFACMQDSWATCGTMCAITNMLLSTPTPVRVILIVCFLARDCANPSPSCVRPIVSHGVHRPCANRRASLSFRTLTLPLIPWSMRPLYTYFCPGTCDANSKRVA